MVFTKHKVRLSSNQMNPGENKAFFSITTNDFSDSSGSDASSDQDQAVHGGPVPPGKNHIQMTGPVVVHGYSVRVYTDFFGYVYQGLSPADVDYTVTDKDNYRAHQLGIMNASLDGTDDDSRRQQRMDKSVKNLKYVMGYRYQPGRSTIMSLLGLTGAVPGDSEYAVNFPKGLQIGTAHLQKKFDRTSLRHVGKGNYKKTKKSGFVLLPNTSTEFFSLGIVNAQHSTSEENDSADGWYFADVTVWMTYDNF